MADYDFSTALVSLGGTADDKTLLDMFKDYVGIDPADTTQDETLSQSLNMAGDMCEAYIDRVIAKRSIDQYFQSHFGRVTLHNHPVDTSVAPVVLLDGVEQTDYKIFLAPWGLANLTRQNCQHDMPLDWRAYEQVVVTYTAGFDPVPSDLAQAIVYVASDLFGAIGTGTPPGGGGSGEIKSMTIHDVGSISYDVGSSGSSGGTIESFGVINDSAAHLLSRYKRMGA